MKLVFSFVSPLSLIARQFPFPIGRRVVVDTSDITLQAILLPLPGRATFSSAALVNGLKLGETPRRSAPIESEPSASTSMSLATRLLAGQFQDDAIGAVWQS
jgi:hypothetical protein